VNWQITQAADPGVGTVVHLKTNRITQHSEIRQPQDYDEQPETSRSDGLLCGELRSWSSVGGKPESWAAPTAAFLRCGRSEPRHFIPIRDVDRSGIARLPWTIDSVRFQRPTGRIVHPTNSQVCPDPVIMNTGVAPISPM
jgi:hypothetical protein